MSRPQEAIARSLLARLPRGWALGRRGGILDALMSAVAAPVADVERDAEAMMDEVDPRMAVRFLPDFERVLGPDPCGRDLADLTHEQRQRIAHQRWTARGGQSVAYFVETAARLGAVIEVEEYWPSVAGGLQAGEPLIAQGEQFTWLVKLALIDEWLFRAGQNAAGEPLGGLTLSDIECELRRLKPAHTQLIFSYTLDEEG